MSLGRLLLACALATTLLGCVTLSEFRALERQVGELRKGQTARSGDPARGRVADLGTEVSDLRAEIEDLRGQLEEVRHIAELAQKDAEAARSASMGSSPPVEPTAAVPEAGAAEPPSEANARPAPPDAEPQPQAAAPAGEPPPSASLSDELQTYEEGFRYYRSGNYEKAVERFRAFLQQYPQSEYGDNALFWLGECYLKQGDHERAILAFEDVTKRYPQGNKVADALYRQGVALLEMGKQTGQEDAYRPAAKDVFERILRDYPDSARVPEARRQLERIGT